MLDLDANDSTIGGGGYLTTYNRDGSAVQVADSDTHIIEALMVTTSRGPRIRLVSGQPGDLLTVIGGTGLLPAGITATPGSGVIILTGSASAGAYESAIELIGFTSTSNSTAQRSISVTVFDGNGGAMATTFVDQHQPSADHHVGRER